MILADDFVTPAICLAYGAVLLGICALWNFIEARRCRRKNAQLEVQLVIAVAEGIVRPSGNKPFDQDKDDIEGLREHDER